MFVKQSFVGVGSTYFYFKKFLKNTVFKKERLQGVGHESLSMFVHFVPNLLSVRYPSSSVAEQHDYAFRLPDESKAVCFRSRSREKAPKGLFLVGDVVEDVRTIFARLQDETIYIPVFC